SRSSQSIQLPGGFPAIGHPGQAAAEAIPGIRTQGRAEKTFPFKKGIAVKESRTVPRRRGASAGPTGMAHL
ncbi:MAG: hypothetical protein ACFE0O_10570, partial [Opitutales bacterium]